MLPSTVLRSLNLKLKIAEDRISGLDLERVFWYNGTRTHVLYREGLPMNGEGTGEKRDLRAEMLSFLEAFVEENGYPPTYDEIRSAVGLSSRSHVLHYLRDLEEQGLIEHNARRPRSLRLVGLSPAAFPVKVEGYIAAGLPIELAQGLEREVMVTADIADPRRDLMALQVKGDSMVDDLVGDGDLLLVERTSDAQRGQVAVAYLRSRNAATLKRIYPEGERVRLQPAHPSLAPLYVDAADIEIQGRLVAVIRRP